MSRYCPVNWGCNSVDSLPFFTSHQPLVHSPTLWHKRPISPSSIQEKKCISAIYVSKKQLVNVARFAEKVPENCKSCQQWERLWIIHNPRASNSHPYSGYLTTLIQHGLVNFSTPHPPPPLTKMEALHHPWAPFKSKILRRKKRKCNTISGSLGFTLYWLLAVYRS